MERPQVEHRPLTLNELEGMLSRYADKAEVVKVIEDAMNRRPSGVPHVVVCATT